MLIIQTESYPLSKPDMTSDVLEAAAAPNVIGHNLSETSMPLRAEVTELLALPHLVPEKACLNAVAVLDKVAQESVAGEKAHSLLKAMFTDSSRVSEVGTALENVNKEMNSVGPEVLAQLQETADADASINGERHKALFMQAWTAGRDVHIPMWGKRVRILDANSASFSRRVNRFLNEATKGTNYMGAFFGCPDGRSKGGWASVRLSESFEAMGGTSEEILKAEDNFLAKELLAFFPEWDGSVNLEGHEDMVVLKRPRESEAH